MPTLTSQSTRIQPSQSASAPYSELLCRLNQGRLFTLDPNYPGGLILIKSFYADFAGPGAAVGGEFDRPCIAIYAIGPIRFRMPPTYVERQQALYRRINYAEKLATITNTPVALRRSCMIVDCLCQWLPPEIAKTIPAEFIGKLVSISPVAVQLAWQARYNCEP